MAKPIGPPRRAVRSGGASSASPIRWDSSPHSTLVPRLSTARLRPFVSIRVHSWLRIFLFEIVNDDLLADGLENLFDELDVGGVILVIVLRFFVAEDDVEGDLVALVDNGAVALRCAADMEMQYAGDGF